MHWEWLLLPLIGALIGWSTNRLAVQMLFRPKKEWRIPLTRFKVQGVLPRRHAEIARVVGETVERDLMSTDTLLEALLAEGYREQVVESVKAHLESRLNNVLPRFVPHGLQLSIISYLKELVGKETVGLIDNLEVTLSHRLKEELSIAAMVEERILQFELDELEKMVTGVAAPELRYIEILGGVLGGLIGIFQAVLLFFLEGT